MRDQGPHKAGVYGFFVHRPLISVQDVLNCDVLEVFHVASKWLGPEQGASWFFHTVGSGIFLDCAAIRNRGRVVAQVNRAEGVQIDDSSIGYFMKSSGISMIAYTEGFPNNPRTEFVVAHANPGHTEYDNRRGACLDDPNIAIPFATGFEGSLPCKCLPHNRPVLAQNGVTEMVSALNCDGTAMSP